MNPPHGAVMATMAAEQVGVQGRAPATAARHLARCPFAAQRGADTVLSDMAHRTPRAALAAAEAAAALAASPLPSLGVKSTFSAPQESAAEMAAPSHGSAKAVCTASATAASNTPGMPAARAAWIAVTASAAPPSPLMPPRPSDAAKACPTVTWRPEPAVSEAEAVMRRSAELMQAFESFVGFEPAALVACAQIASNSASSVDQCIAADPHAAVTGCVCELNTAVDATLTRCKSRASPCSFLLPRATPSAACATCPSTWYEACNVPLGSSCDSSSFQILSVLAMSAAAEYAAEAAATAAAGSAAAAPKEAAVEDTVAAADRCCCLMACARAAARLLTGEARDARLALSATAAMCMSCSERTAAPSSRSNTSVSSPRSSSVQTRPSAASRPKSSSRTSSRPPWPRARCAPSAA
mmetsp:Transcript_15270/g.36999  ORF Transcript_15270/g.36999 Transcript_15270/m.36999 type:complete len:412 (+) Transcript_15270:107-1342(+)